jgi:hypothetical protein
MIEKIFTNCKPDEDIAHCFNQHENVIKKIQVAKNSRTNQPYQNLGRFYALPLSLSKAIPEFDERSTPNARKAYKSMLEKSIEANEQRMLEKHDDMVINWKEVIRARKFWEEEARETDDLTSWRGATVMALYTLTPPLRNDCGCVMLVTSEPNDKKRNYYWPERGAFYLNHFKTMKRYSDEPPIIFHKDLKTALKKWIKRSGAKTWLFSKDNSDPCAGCSGNNKAGSFASVVKRVASRFLVDTDQGDPPVSINVLRKSKVGDLIKNKATNDYRQRVARLMRHSLSTATKAYKRTAYSDNDESDAEDILSEGDFYSEDD